MGRGKKRLLVECGRCKQWISGDSLGLGRACVEGKRWEKEARELKKKAMEGANKEGGEKE